MVIIFDILVLLLVLAVICGVILIAIPLFRILSYQKLSDRPYLTIKLRQKSSYQLKNTGRNQCRILNIFFDPETKYFEGLNDVSFAPSQALRIQIPEYAKEALTMEVKYQDEITKTIYTQKFPLETL